MTQVFWCVYELLKTVFEYLKNSMNSYYELICQMNESYLFTLEKHRRNESYRIFTFPS